MRRPEYAAATGAASARGAGDYGEGFAAAPRPTRRSPLALVEAVGRFVVHYPSYIVFVALANRDGPLSARLRGHERRLRGARAPHASAATLGRTTMKAIIVAAGRGRRLGPETDEIPKCMVEVAGRPILHRQLDALAAAGVDDVVIVRGYLGDRIDRAARPAARRCASSRTPTGPSNNILTSLLYAEARDGGRVPVLLLGHRVRARARPPRWPRRRARSRWWSIGAGATPTRGARCTR